MLRNKDGNILSENVYVGAESTNFLLQFHVDPQEPRTCRCFVYENSWRNISNFSKLFFLPSGPFSGHKRSLDIAEESHCEPRVQLREAVPKISNSVWSGERRAARF